ncbi:hypothetical protein V8C44DRAFT_332163 [Trichoderma aethiopicum]
MPRTQRCIISLLPLLQVGATYLQWRRGNTHGSWPLPCRHCDPGFLAHCLQNPGSTGLASIHISSRPQDRAATPCRCLD